MQNPLKEAEILAVVIFCIVAAVLVLGLLRSSPLTHKSTVNAHALYQEFEGH